MTLLQLKRILDEGDAMEFALQLRNDPYYYVYIVPIAFLIVFGFCIIPRMKINWYKHFNFLLPKLKTTYKRKDPSNEN